MNKISKRSLDKLETSEVEKIAILARLDLTDTEKEKYGEELSNILGYVEMIGRADIKDVEPTAQVTGLSDVFRGDKSVPSKLSRDEILANVPDKKDGYIKVKPILGGDDTQL